jgi:hypothetical protein
MSVTNDPKALWKFPDWKAKGNFRGAVNGNFYT